MLATWRWRLDVSKQILQLPTPPQLLQSGISEFTCSCSMSRFHKICKCLGVRQLLTPLQPPSTLFPRVSPYLANWMRSCFRGWKPSKKPSTSKTIGYMNVINVSTIVISFWRHQFSSLAGSVERFTTSTTAYAEAPRRATTAKLTRTRRPMILQLNTETVDKTCVFHCPGH